MWSNDEMIGKFLERWLGSGGEKTSGGEVLSSETYNGFDIHAAPVKEAGGWRVTGTITKIVDGEEKTHRFIRADTCADADSAASMTQRKARQLIDERGDRLFD